jgi:Holliday junction resolvasome RuvABC endonuclease subunit
LLAKSDKGCVGPTLADLAGRLTAFLYARLRTDPVTLIAFEGPFATGRHHDRLSFGLCGVVEMVCAQRQVACVEYAPATLKKAWTGSGRAAKGAMLVEAKARGLNPRSDHEADAAAVWWLAALAHDADAARHLSATPLERAAA